MVGGKDLFKIGVVGNGGLNSKEGGKDLFRIGVVGNGSLNSTEGGRGARKEREGRICSGWVCLATGA